METDHSIVSLTDIPKPIDVPSVAGWKEIPIKESENPEPLVPLGPFSEYDRVYTSSIYRGEHSNSPYPDSQLEGSMLTVFVREGTAKQLKTAETSLPSGMHLIVFDAYRSLDIQQSLYNQYRNALAKFHPDWDETALATETQKYVSLPASLTLNPETKFASPHNTGGAVDVAIFKLPDDVEQEVQDINAKVAELDVTGDQDAWKSIYELQMKKIGLINQNAQMLNFGTRFDYGGPEAALDYFEELAKQRPLTSAEKEAQENRRLLFNAMLAAGFQPYRDEWWHYNSEKTQMGAKTAGLDHAEYGSAALSYENKKHEQMRIDHRIGTIRLHEGTGFQNPNVSDAYFDAAKKGASETGDLRLVTFPEVEKIEPPKAA